MSLTTDFRIVCCEACGSEGKLYTGQYEDERCTGDCPCCDGTGGELIPVDPIELEDLDTMGGTP